VIARPPPAVDTPSSEHPNQARGVRQRQGEKWTAAGLVAKCMSWIIAGTVSGDKDGHPFMVEAVLRIP